MRNLVATTTICAVLFCIASAYPQNIPNKYDNVNIDAILSNDRVVNNYIKCLLDKGSCTQEGRDLKKTLPDAIRTDCQRCTPQQKQNTEKVIRFLKQRRQREWKELVKKYDPQNVHSARYL